MDSFTAIFQSPDGFLRSKPFVMSGTPPLEIRRARWAFDEVTTFIDGELYLPDLEDDYTVYRLTSADPYSIAYFYTEVPSNTRAPKPAHRGMFEITIEPA